mgnify:CR=1 FL=1
MSDYRGLLERLHQAAIDAVAGRTAVARALAENRVPSGPLHVVAVGKAAAAMLHGAVDVRGDEIVAALLITREGYDDPSLAQRLSVAVHTAPHPVPDERSLVAGDQLVEFIQQAPADAHFLILVSGGASSLVERLPGRADASALAALNAELLASGRDIGQMNRLRKAVSTIKGGRLARWLMGRRTDVLLISDVPGDDPAVIGSGLLFADDQPADPAEVDAVCPPGLSPADPAPSPDDPCFTCVHGQIIASNATALEAVKATAEADGWRVTTCPDRLHGEATTLGRTLAQVLVDGPPGLTVWGGEPTVSLPENPGRGGRMQAFALAAATVLQHRAAWLLAAGTDGADGPGEDAGAIVDGASIDRGVAQHWDAETALRQADAGGFLRASGDLLHTGATGTNVMDIVIGLKPD